MQDTTNRPYHHGDLRREIIETAMAMLHEDKGWQFTLREVARRAGVSHAAPYKHFPDKAALLAEMAMLGFERLHKAMTTAKAKGPGPLRGEFFAVGRAYVRFGTSNPGLYRLMFSAEAGKAVNVHLSESALAVFGVVTELLERGQAEGVLRKRDVRGRAAACWAQMHGITMLTMEGLFQLEKVGPDPLDAALTTLLEGLEN
ncbi:TetR/AcrR family transcriptional regulator [Mesorhizobium sp. M0488]|uniref:TetR/AcrR family transcriptional regulator n=1 Tax=unclassified Mesorhizobium TaxID=325217 RepID=UPI00333DF4BA